MVSVILRSKFPMFLWWGTELIQFYNDAYRPSLGAGGKHPHALGERGVVTWPEIWPVIKPMIDQVLAGGEATWNEDALIPINRNGTLEDVYWTFGYSCVTDDSGEPAGVLVICNETTQKVNLLNTLQKSGEALAKTRTEAEQERDRMKRFLMEAPMGICILEGPEMVFEFINPTYQQLFPGRDLLGRPLLAAIPELRQQPIMDALRDVYLNNLTFDGQAILIPLRSIETGLLEDRYFNFIYQPKSDYQGKVAGIMVFAFEVTKMVWVEKDLAKTKETLNSAIRAAELGIFDYDLQKDLLEWNEQCRLIFGINHHDPISYEKDFLARIHPDDLKEVLNQIRRSGLQGENHDNFDVEFRILLDEDGEIKWIKTWGKFYFDQYNQPLRFIGALMDITEPKTNEIKKNDFIGIVSHELKTPLTSLTGYAQLLSRSIGSSNQFVDGVLQKMNAQVKKMTSLINGFLNVSLFEAGRIELKKDWFDMEVLLNDIREELAMTSTSHQIMMNCPMNFNLWADREKIASVIYNLLSNSIKYSPMGKQIVVDCSTNGDSKIFTVTDVGMGIKAQDLPKVFDRFYRSASKHTQNISGFGIGLYLSAEIIRLHGGKIWVESKIGVGSSFHFSLPESISDQDSMD